MPEKPSRQRVQATQIQQGVEEALIDYERRDYDRLREEFGKLEEENRHHLEYIGKLESMVDELEQRVEVVRCRDCRAMRVKYGNTGIECWMNGEPFTVEPDGFCAWAVRRDT